MSLENADSEVAVSEWEAAIGTLLMPWNLAHLPGCSRFPGVRQGKSMVLAFIGQQIQTPSGIMAGQGSTNWYKSAYFRRRPYDPDHQPTSPDAVILCEDYKQVQYVAPSKLINCKLIHTFIKL